LILLGVPPLGGYSYITLRRAGLSATAGLSCILMRHKVTDIVYRRFNKRSVKVGIDVRVCQLQQKITSTWQQVHSYNLGSRLDEDDASLPHSSCFQVLLFKTLTFHKVVYWHTWGVVVSLAIMLLQTFSWFWQWKNFENRLIFDKVKEFNKNCAIFEPPCTCTLARSKEYTAKATERDRQTDKQTQTGMAGR